MTTNVSAEAPSVETHDSMKFSNSDCSLDDAVEYVIKEKYEFTIPNPELLIRAIGDAKRD